MDRFVLKAPYAASGDQPEAIEALARGVREGLKDQILLGVTGSGKTFTMASVIESRFSFGNVGLVGKVDAASF